MGRAFGASLGCLAIVGCILGGLIVGSSPEYILVRSLLCVVPFLVIGWLAGSAADQAIRHSLEMDFRKRVARMRETKESPNRSDGRLGNPAKAGN
jgi:hypothetical protein